MGRKNIYLVGKDPKSTAFAVYSFLEDLGCRWFMPGKPGEVVPHEVSLKWDVKERTEKPDFPFRQIWWAYGGPKETAHDFELWKLRNKLSNPKINHGHNLVNTLPPSKYFKKHPEYYSLVNGKREPRQLCTSNPSVVKLVTDSINRYFDEHPDVEAYSLCPDDNTDFCECDRCRALDVGGRDKYMPDKPVVTDRYIHFLNQVAKGIQKKHPGKKVTTYAYVNYSTPPVREKIDPNVVVVFTTSMYCGAHGIGDLQCESRQQMKHDLAGWAKLCSNIYIYDYDPIPYNAELPWPLFGARYREMQEYLSMGIKGFSFESHDSWATLSPNFYVAAKAMWQSDIDFDELMDDFTQKYYQESVEPMSEYYEVLEGALAEYPDKVPWGQTAYPQIFTDEVLDKCRRAIDWAVADARTEELKKRVNVAALGFEYLDNYIKLRKAAEKNITFDEFKKKYQRCKDIVDELYAMNKDYILHDVAIEYLNKGLGRISTDAFAKELGMVIAWNVIGPFYSEDGKLHEKVFHPEKEIDFKASYSGKKGRKISWKEIHNPEYIGKIDFVSVFNESGLATAYAETTVTSPEKRDVQFRIGSNDLVKVWLNGKEVWDWNSRSGRLVKLDDDIVNVTIPKGRSTILLKVTNLGGRWGFCFRITDKEGNKIPDLKFDLQ